MADQLTHDDIQRMVNDAVEAMPLEECRSCDCFQAFFVQLDVDSDGQAVDITSPFKVVRERMHGCLGCDPCPPAADFAKYLKRQERQRAQQTNSADRKGGG
jgi:hypothetical protein